MLLGDVWEPGLPEPLRTAVAGHGAWGPGAGTHTGPAASGALPACLLEPRAPSARSASAGAALQGVLPVPAPPLVIALL